MNNDTHKSHLTSSQKDAVKEFSMEINRICMSVFVVLLTLKLAQVGVVQYWSWYYITMPLWLPGAILFATWLAISALIYILKFISNEL